MTREARRYESSGARAEARPAITKAWSALEPRILASLEELMQAVTAEQDEVGPLTRRAYGQAEATLRMVAANRLLIDQKALADAARKSRAAALRRASDRGLNRPASGAV